MIKKIVNAVKSFVKKDKETERFAKIVDRAIQDIPKKDYLFEVDYNEFMIQVELTDKDGDGLIGFLDPSADWDDVSNKMNELAITWDKIKAESEEIDESLN